MVEPITLEADLIEKITSITNHQEIMEASNKVIAFITSGHLVLEISQLSKR